MEQILVYFFENKEIIFIIALSIFLGVEVISNVPETQLYFVGSDEKGKILIGGKGVLLASRDNGKNWMQAKCDPPISYGWLYGLSRQGSAGFVSVGCGGAIYNSGTQAWQKVLY